MDAEGIPDHIVQHIFGYLSPVSVARCACTSVRWRALGSADAVWRPMCRLALDRYHPRPTLASSHVSVQSSISLSIAHQHELNARHASEKAALDEAKRLADFRLAVIAELRRQQRSLGTYVLAFRCVPMIRTSGVYTLRHEYIRKGVRDMFHVYEGTLRVVYHRTFLFRSDGTLLYSMLPGDYTESFKEFKRSLAAEAEAKSVRGDDVLLEGPLSRHAGAGEDLERIPTAGSGTSRPEAPSVSATTGEGGVPAVGGLTLGMGFSRGRTSEASQGTWHLEGDTLVATVRCARYVTLLWRCGIRSDSGALHNRLVVDSLHLVEGPTAAVTPMTQVFEEEFFWRQAPTLAILTNTTRGACFF